jgi:Lrp/AsnC family leucine-responsive transcriptional regulator
MDKIDTQIIKLLQENGRMTWSQLSRELHLSRPSVKERFQRLKEKGVITGFTANVPHYAVNKNLLVFILIDLKIPYKEFEAKIANTHAIIECHKVTGSASYILKAALSSREKLSELIDFLIPCGKVNTFLVLSSPITNKPMLPEE